LREWSTLARRDVLSERRRVVIVDNDLVTRSGTRAVLEGVDDVELVDAVDHDTALGWAAEWDGVDVAVVDASDIRREGDQFPGVAVVEAIRRRRAPAELVTVVLTGQAFHAGLRRRMWEAGADFFYPRNEGMTEGELAAVVLRPEDRRRMSAVVGEVPRELGVGRRTLVNEVIRRLDSPATGAALDPSGAKKQDPHGARSRWWDQFRARAAGPAGLVPVKAGGDVALDQDMPSIPQLRKFWAAMTRARGADEP
jgi:CheY-like chemotaxis protein